MSSALVTIVTPLYNSINYIEESVQSVVNQTYENWEMILVDDCSSDGSLELINKIAKIEKRLKIIQNKENQGSGISRNKAIKLAKGKYIAFLDSDDLWHKDKLKIQIDLMEKNNWSFSHTSYGYISEKGKIPEKCKLSKEYRRGKTPSDPMPSPMFIAQDLFIMTVTIVFRNLE